MDAVVLAGGEEKPGSPLYEITNGKNKSFLNLGGKSMIQWTVDAIAASETIDRLHIIGITSSAGINCSKPLEYYPDQGSMLSNILAGIELVHDQHPQATHVLLASGDIPSITPDIVDWRVRSGLEHDVDIDYAVVEEHMMETRFPGANRSYIKLKDYTLCGGDMNLVHVKTIKTGELWEQLVAARKNILKQAALVGWDVFALLLLRQLTLDNAVRRVCKNLGISAHATLCPYPEVAMDIDKPHQLEILRADLTQD